MKLRPITSEQYTDLEEGYMLLLRVSAIFRRGDTPKTYARIKLALTSAQGAIRHARRRADASGARLIVKLPKIDQSYLDARELAESADHECVVVAGKEKS